MRFRWKLLILLIVIAIVPIVAMRTFGARSARSLATQLMAQSRKEVISRHQKPAGSFHRQLLPVALAETAAA